MNLRLHEAGLVRAVLAVLLLRGGALRSLLVADVAGAVLRHGRRRDDALQVRELRGQARGRAHARAGLARLRSMKPLASGALSPHPSAILATVQGCQLKT